MKWRRRDDHLIECGGRVHRCEVLAQSRGSRDLPDALVWLYRGSVGPQWVGPWRLSIGAAQTDVDEHERGSQ